jgi:hypothetical protein
MKIVAGVVLAGSMAAGISAFGLWHSPVFGHNQESLSRKRAGVSFV